MSALQDFWSTSRWTRDYGWRPLPGEENPYTLGYHIGQDIAGRTWLTGVPALRAGKVVRVGRSGVIGGYVVIQADADGRYDGYAHMNTEPNNLPGVGERISRGQNLGKLARSTLPWAGDNYTGSGSDGPHLHFTISYKADNSWNPVRGYDLDPRPYIRSALAGPETAGGGSTPFEPQIPKEWDEMATEQQVEDAAYRAATRAFSSYRDRRGFAIIWVGADAWIVDFAAGTRYNAARGFSSVSDTINFISWLRDGLGWPELKNQPPFTIAGTRDITN